MGLFKALFGDANEKAVKRLLPLRDKVLALEETYRQMSTEELKAQTDILKARLADGETTDDILPEAFAVCREAADRVLGMRHFPVQILGGIVLHQGRIAEMRTGEGKTLVATLPAYLNALTGKGVHIVTVNDYLARRDSEWMGKVYRYLGLSVGLIVHGLTNAERREAYAADITYGTNNELGFDYLRDNMVLYKEDLVQRGHHFAIVDEVDSILIDEARTPLIISGQGDKSTDLYARADQFAKRLKVFRIKEMDTKKEQDSVDGDYIVDEKAKTATLTRAGVEKAEKFFAVDNLMDMENVTLLHHINQAIKACGVMRRDVDYVVKDGQVVIVDEFTGRLMPGRRYNEGLHQAIEAKEGVQVERESKTLATVTFQNYFRLYSKLSGMTGTAKTEAAEFGEIYRLDVVEIPTNKPVVRNDMPDAIYKSEKAKIKAVVEQIAECHARKQPVLVGTVSIEKSEVLSKILRAHGIPHEVLNAKYHEKEAGIIAQAGKLGAVTIATNMAGRGTDIMLGGNPEFMAKAQMRADGMPEELIAESTAFGETDNEEILAARATFKALHDTYKAQIAPEAEAVRAAGGLFIIGTERHESRRIDNQLRGRAGRQGDPGASRFYMSFEDDLLRLFGGSQMDVMMGRIGMTDELALELPMVSKVIESAQKRVEDRNFQIRRDVLKYDDVMNKQREIIYGQRKEVLDGKDMKTAVFKMVTDNIEETVALFTGSENHEEWNLASLREHFLGLLTTPTDFHYSAQELEDLEPSDLVAELTDRAEKRYAAQENLFGEGMREVERVVLLQNVDTYWMEHIDNMDQLRAGIHLRAYGQHDPVVAYRLEGFDLFDEMINTIRETTARMILAVRPREEEPQRKAVAKESAASVGGDTSDKKRPVRKTAAEKIGRNDPCPCGSGKKYKKCCGSGVTEQ